MRRRALLTFLFLIVTTLFVQWQGRLDIVAGAVAVPAKNTAFSNVKVATYNIRGCRDDLGIADPHDIAQELKSINADVIALQEVDNTLPRSQFVNQAKAIANLLHMNYVYAPSINFVVGTYGNALLSKYPILSAEGVELPYETEPRGMIDALIDINGFSLQVYVTHLGLKQSEKKQQTQFLYDYLKGKKGRSSILLGDFNSKRNDPLLHPLRTLFDDPLGKSSVHVDKIKGKIAYGSIDHIFLSNDLVFEYADKILTKSRSDHVPVIFSIHFSG